MKKWFLKLLEMTVLLLITVMVGSNHVQASEDELDFNQQSITIHLKEGANTSITNSPSEEKSESLLPFTGEAKHLILSIVGIITLIVTFIVFIYWNQKRRHLHEN